MANGKKTNSSGRPSQNLPVPTIEKFLNNQSAELEIQRQGIQQQAKTDEMNYKYATKALEAQVKDREDSRKHEKFFMRGLFIIVLLVLGIISAFTWYCLKNGQTQMIISILKFLAYVLPSSFGGYFAGVAVTRRKMAGQNFTQYKTVSE